jgi:cellulose synthase/poly-beta-1,6-N-acetylglucosamine synthase-like glycosyltransferase
MKKDSRINTYYLSKHIFKNNFYAETVNLAVSKSNNKFICIVDADTMLEQDYIKKLIIHLNEHLVSVSGIMIHLHRSYFHFHEKIRGSGRLIKKEVWDSIGGFKDILTCDTYLELEFMKRGWKTKVIDNIIQYDLRKYTMKQLTRRAIRRGKGRRQIGQSFLFMLGHGLYMLLNSPFGIVELTGNIIGYLSTEKRSSEELNKIYEYNRIIEVVDKYQKLLRQ